MRILFVLAILFFSLNSVFSQKKSNPLFFNEITLSVNRTMIDNSNSEGKFGFGAGLYRTWMDSSWFNLAAGISYNKTSYFKKTVFSGNQFQQLRDVTYNLHSLSIPFIIRFNVGHKTRLFIETGGFIEFNIAGNRKGTFYSTNPLTDPVEIVQKEKFSPSILNGGFVAGIGTSIPIKFCRLIIKADYVFGIKAVEANEEALLNRYIRFSIGLRKL